MKRANPDEKNDQNPRPSSTDDRLAYVAAATGLIAGLALVVAAAYMGSRAAFYGDRWKNRDGIAVHTDKTLEQQTSRPRAGNQNISDYTNRSGYSSSNSNYYEHNRNNNNNNNDNKKPASLTSREHTTSNQQRGWGPVSPTRLSEIQQVLFLLGLYDGPVDGAFNRALWSAVAAFQQKRGLRESGNLDRDTSTALHRESQLIHAFIRLKAMLSNAPANWGKENLHHLLDAMHIPPDDYARLNALCTPNSRLNAKIREAAKAP